MLDLTGTFFGNLQALNKTSERHKGSVIWECRCMCGNISKFSSQQLKYTKDCGCGSKKYVKPKNNIPEEFDITNQRFGRLIAVKLVDPTKFNKWICKCGCGKITVGYVIQLKTGRKKSCGCLKKDPKALTRRKNLKRLKTEEIGKKYGKLTILGFVGKNSSNNHIIKVKCDCGKQTEKLLSSLKSGCTKSCGCIARGRKPKHRVENNVRKLTRKLTRKEKAKRIETEEIGKKYSKLTILEYAGFASRNHHVKVKCDCGTVKTLRYDNVYYSHTKSCGCIRISKAKKKVVSQKVTVFQRIKSFISKFKSIKFNIS